MMPGNLTYKVLSANLTVFLNGTAGTGPEVLGARVTFALADANASGWLDQGDIFTLSVDPPERAVLLAGGRVDAFNDSRHSNIVGLAKIPFLGPLHVGLSISAHSDNSTTITVTSVENLPPTPFADLRIRIYNHNNAGYTYSGGDRHESYVDADADGAFSAGDQFVVAADPYDPDSLTGGRIEVWFHLELVGVLSPLP